MQIATRQSGLEHIACVNRAFGFTRTDHRMNFIDEHDGLPRVLLNLVEHGF